MAQTRQTAGRRSTRAARAAGDGKPAAGNGKAKAPAKSKPSAGEGGNARPVTLGDLSAKDRAAVLAEARAEAQAEAAAPTTDQEARAAKRDAGIRELLDPRDHLRKCPMTGRVEAYGDKTPAKPERGEPAKPITVVRCIECGGTAVVDEPYESLIQRLEDSD